VPDDRLGATVVADRDEGSAGRAQHPEQYGGPRRPADRGLEPEVQAEIGQPHQHPRQLVGVGFTGTTDERYLSLVHGFSLGRLG